MIDFAEALADQSDLRALCTRITDDMLVERFKFNESYGFARALKEYAGYPLGASVEAVIPHGVYLNASQMLELERDSGLPAVLNYPAFRSEVWQHETGLAVLPSASPFLYALSMFRDRFQPREDASGTLFFPAHTVQTLRTNADWAAVARELRSLDERYQPVTVCVHPVDFIKGLHAPFVRAGLEIVSAGNTFDSEFTYRWLHLLSRHRFAASNDVGGAAFYATAAGKPIFLLDEIADQFYDPAVHVIQRAEDFAQAKETKRRIVELFRGDPEAPHPDREQVVEYLLGAENFKSPEGLLGDLEYVAGLAQS